MNANVAVIIFSQGETLIFNISVIDPTLNFSRMNFIFYFLFYFPLKEGLLLKS